MPDTEYKQLQLDLAKRMSIHVTLCNAIDTINNNRSGNCIFFYINQYSVPTGAIVPFLDPESLVGYGVNWILQLAACYATFAAMLGLEVYVCIADSNVKTMKELSKYQLHQFNRHIIDKKSDNFVELKYILVMLNDIKTYVDFFNKTLYYKSFLQPTFTVVCVAIGVFCQYAVSIDTIFGY